jgi:hypothetical protein
LFYTVGSAKLHKTVLRLGDVAEFYNAHAGNCCRLKLQILMIRADAYSNLPEGTAAERLLIGSSIRRALCIQRFTHGICEEQGDKIPLGTRLVAVLGYMKRNDFYCPNGF